MAKRELLCGTCAPGARLQFPNPEPYPGEHVKFVDGAAVDKFICDGCGALIAKGDATTCLSIWADYGGQPYAPWENHYIDETKTT